MAEALLPVELILYIFDMVATSARDTILSLCLVASWAHHVYLPKLLHIVDITSDRQSRDFMARLPPERIRHRLSYIHTLWVDHSVQFAQHNPVFQTCDIPNLRCLSVPYSLFTAMVLACSVTPAIGLQVVLSGDVPENALCMRALWDGHAPPLDDVAQSHSLDAPLLNAITHLQLTCPAIGWRSPVFLCANLTHLAMPFVGAMGFTSPIRSLEMMVFIVPSYRSQPTHWDCRMRVMHARTRGRPIYTVTDTDERFKDHWLESLTGEHPDIWERAKSQTRLLEQVIGQLIQYSDAADIL